MKTVYLILAIVGYSATFPLMMMESLATNNWLLLTKPILTWDGLFANRISTIFALDLLPAVFAFLIWAMAECRRLGMKNIWMWWAGALLFGLGGTFPLFLWAREGRQSA